MSFDVALEKIKRRVIRVVHQVFKEVFKIQAERKTSVVLPYLQSLKLQPIVKILSSLHLTFQFHLSLAFQFSVTPSNTTGMLVFPNFLENSS